MKLILYGAGGHSKVVLASLQNSKEFTVTGFIDDAKSGTYCMLPILGGPDILNNLDVQGALITIGDNRVRREKIKLLQSQGFQMVRVVDERAIVDSSVVLGAGSVILPGAIVNAGTIIGENVIVNTGAIIEHDCSIGNNVHIAPGVTIAGGASIGESTLLGVRSTILPGISIGSNTTIGAGAVVVKNVKSNVVASGVPARVTRENT